MKIQYLFNMDESEYKENYSRKTYDLIHEIKASTIRGYLFLYPLHHSTINKNFILI